MFIPLGRVLALLSCIGFVLAHPGEHHPVLSDSEILERQNVIKQRHTQARKCSHAVQSYQESRKVKRALERRDFRHHHTSRFTTATMSASRPTIPRIKNFTCVTTPEVIEGPYYINNELIRQDLRERQRGITLELDIGVLDTVTCKPLSGVFIELWSSNATGFYGGYTHAPILGPPPGSGTAPPPAPSGPPGGGTPGAPYTNLTDTFTWLRGGWPTNKHGMVGLKTIYPGFYQGRAIHVHVMVHHNWSANDNGTLVSHAGTVQHTGQFFFDDAWSDKVVNTTAYRGNTNDRTYNDRDIVFAQEASGGNSALVELELAGDCIEDGLIGYITMGVNTSEVVTIQNTNYYNTTDPRCGKDGRDEL